MESSQSQICITCQKFNAYKEGKCAGCLNKKESTEKLNLLAPKFSELVKWATSVYDQDRPKNMQTLLQLMPTVKQNDLGKFITDKHLWFTAAEAIMYFLETPNVTEGKWKGGRDQDLIFIIFSRVVDLFNLQQYSGTCILDGQYQDALHFFSSNIDSRRYKNNVAVPGYVYDQVLNQMSNEEIIALKGPKNYQGKPMCTG